MADPGAETSSGDIDTTSDIDSNVGDGPGDYGNPSNMISEKDFIGKYAYLEPTMKNILKSIAKGMSIPGTVANIVGMWDRRNETAKGLVEQGYYTDLDEAKKAVDQHHARGRASIENIDPGFGPGREEPVLTRSAYGNGVLEDNYYGDSSTGTPFSTDNPPPEGGGDRTYSSPEEAYIYSDPVVTDAYNQAVAMNPNWGTPENMIKWAKGNFQQRQDEGQDVTWPELDESGNFTNSPGEETPEDTNPFGYGDISLTEGDITGAMTQGRQDFDEAYNKAIASLDAGLNQGRTDIMGMLNEIKEGLQPYGDVGEAALQQLWQKVQAGPGEFKESPDYQFRVQEGQKLLERQASARGDLGAGGLSGRFAKELTRYGQEMGSQEYGNWLNRWYQSLGPYQNLASQGLQAQGVLTQARSTAGGQLANLEGSTAANKASAAMSTGAGKSALGMAGAGLLADYRMNKENLATAKDRLGLGRETLAAGISEAKKDRDWREKMAERHAEIYKDIASERRGDDILKTGIIGGLGLLNLFK